MYIPPDVLIRILEIKKQYGIKSTAEAMRILARRKQNNQKGWSF